MNVQTIFILKSDDMKNQRLNKIIFYYLKNQNNQFFFTENKIFVNFDTYLFIH